MRIGDLAKQTNTKVETIRFYEKEGLLPEAHRTENNYRDYQQEHLERLRFIRNCRAFDMSHEEIRELISLVDSHAENCGSVNHLLDRHIEHIENRISELTDLLSNIKLLRQQCQQQEGIDSCRIIHGLASFPLNESSEKKSHLS